MVALVASTRPELSGAGPRLALGAWAAAACLARVLHRRHYVGDVLAGVAVGVAVAGEWQSLNTHAWPMAAPGRTGKQLAFASFYAKQCQV